MQIIKYLLICLVLFLTFYKLFPTVYYKGPVSDHFDGKRFYNSIKGDKSFFSILKWQLTRHKPVWPKLQLLQQYDYPPKIVDNSSVRVSAIGHSTLLIQTHGINILTDPIWSEVTGPFSLLGAKRSVMPGVEFKDLPKIDIVLISHNHYDHMDQDTIVRLYKDHNPLFITPLGNDTILKKMAPNIKVQSLDWFENVCFNKIKIWTYPAQHWSSRWIIDRDRALWGAFIIETPTDNLYFAGDTGYGNGDHFKQAQKKFKKFKIAFLPIGAFKPEWFMEYAHINPSEAVQAMIDLNAEHAVAIHFGTFLLADDQYEEPIICLKDSLKNFPYLDFKVLEPGRSSIFK
jgi:L-ascorbate metabolism protein UlaG (beta-lactamase superfamily)